MLIGLGKSGRNYKWFLAWKSQKYQPFVADMEVKTT